MNLLRRIFNMNGEGSAQAEQIACEASEQAEPTLREQLLAMPDFAAYLQNLAENKNVTVDSFDDQEVESLYQIWTDSKDKGFDSATLTAIGMGAIGAMALFSPPANASLGTQIANQIIKQIEPFVGGLLKTAMSTLGMDISNGQDKIAIAAGQGVDAQNEVAKTIYNKEAARAAEPAPNECLSTEAANRVRSSDERTSGRIDDIVARDSSNNIYIRTTMKRAAQRMAAVRFSQDKTIYDAAQIPPNAPPEKKIEALTTAASVTTFTSSVNMDQEGVKKAESHVAALFKDTKPKIDLDVEVDSPTAREALDRQVENEATLNHCKVIFDRDIAERTGTEEEPSFRKAIADKVASEYGSEAFAEEQRAKTHAVPMLKTLVEQQSFANMMAVKNYEQQSEILKLQALQLKESVRKSIS